MEHIGRELKGLLKKHKVSVYKIAEDLGVAHESLYRSLNDGANPEWKRVKQILDYLGYDLKFIKRRKVKPSKPSKGNKR